MKTPPAPARVTPSPHLSNAGTQSLPPAVSRSAPKVPPPHLGISKPSSQVTGNSHLSGNPAHNDGKQPSRGNASPRVSPRPSVTPPGLAAGLNGGLSRPTPSDRPINGTTNSSGKIPNALAKSQIARPTALAPRPTQKVAAARPHIVDRSTQLAQSAHRSPLRGSRPISTHLAPAISSAGVKGSPASRATLPARLSPPLITTASSRGLYRPQHGNHGHSSSGGNGHWGNYGVWRNFNHGSYHSAHHGHVPIYPTLLSSVNYALVPRYWGSDPWWSCGYTNSWYHGSWNYGWNHHWHDRYAYYRRPLFSYPPGYNPYYYTSSSFVPWGLASWTLGRLAYDTGYYSYYNPYPTSPVIIDNTVIRYSEPITTIASNVDTVRTEDEAKTAEEKARAAMDRARDAFRRGDYVTASTAIDDAISQTPGNSVFHEFRALTLFALGRYDDAAGVLHSVLASGPGWNWETMIDFYGDPEQYTNQFRRLEDYVVANPGSAPSRLLLAYHYMVGGNLTEAAEMLDQVVEIQPRDTVAAQLRSLLKDSDAEATAEKLAEKPATEATKEAPTEEADKAPISKEALAGIWKAKSAEGKTITLSLTAIGTFSWEYEGASEKVLSGEWSLDKDGLLVLADEDVQMVGDIDLNPDGTLHFLMAGSPDGDPGLTFQKE